jgi:hypothetical protein
MLNETNVKAENPESQVYQAFWDDFVEKCLFLFITTPGNHSKALILVHFRASVYC